MWDQVEEGIEPGRIARYRPVRPITAADLRAMVRELDRLGYPDDCPVQVQTPLPPRDRRVVAFHVLDFTPQQPQENNP